MKSSIRRLTFGICLLAALNLCAQPTQQPARLAIIAEDSDSASVVDLLTAELSKAENVQLLEREAIGRVYREQALSAAGADYLKLGQVLGADGLLLLSARNDKGTSDLSLQLVAIKPGVLLASGRFNKPTTAMQQWAGAVHRYFQPFMPKLIVPERDAIPLSIVNLRSAIQSDEAREAERQLTLLAIERLSREPRLFVLERRRMQLLTAEKSLKGVDEDAFWQGSFLLDGTLDNAGYSKDTLTLSARLTPPKGGAPVQIEVQGSRTNFTEIINRFADKILENLKLNRGSKPWNAGEEAQQFYAEAQWALKWGLYPQAQTAIESAWALGKKDADTATLGVRAYSENVAIARPVMISRAQNMSDDNLYVPLIPEVEKLRPLVRAMELFHQNNRQLLATNTADAGFEMGVQLIQRGGGMAESFYHAAEARTGNEEALADLRQGLRDIFADLEQHPPRPPIRRSLGDDLAQSFKWLQWTVGGLCCEEPEAALPGAGALLAAGFHPVNLPRVVGWSWSARQRVPKLEREFVREVCANTNIGVRLEGLYLAMRLAPGDEQGSRRKSEAELVTAMWENRDWIYAEASRVSLVIRTEEVLKRRHKHSVDDSFEYEPFTSTKHKLRLDFLTRYTGTNIDLFQAVFPSYPRETPEQARELIPLVTKLKQRWSPWPVNSYLQSLQQRAGQPMTPPDNLPITPVDSSSGEVVEAKFVRWKLTGQGDLSGRKLRADGLTERNGLLWARVRHVKDALFDDPFDPETRVNYVAVDPQTGVKLQIAFPKELGIPGKLFEVSTNTLYVEAKGHLYARPLNGKDWQEIIAPMEGAMQMIWTKGRLLVSRGDGLMEVQPESGQVRVLVSSRRQPAANNIDPLWTLTAHLFRWQDGRLGVLTDNHCLSLEPLTEKWNVREIALSRTNNPYREQLWSASSSGALWFLGNPGPSMDYVAGYWGDDKPSETMLVHTELKALKDGNADRVPNWEWPSVFPLEFSSIAVGERTLSILCARKIWIANRMPIADEPLKFADDREATLLRFEPAFRQPLRVGLRFQDDGADRSKVNGARAETLNPSLGGFAGAWERAQNPGAPMPFWLETSAGLVFGGPDYGGHWLLSQSSLEKSFAAQRRSLPRQPSSRVVEAPTSPKL